MRVVHVDPPIERSALVLLPSRRPGRPDGITAAYDKPHNGTGVVKIMTSKPPQGWPLEITVKFPKNLHVHGLKLPWEQIILATPQNPP